VIPYDNTKGNVTAVAVTNPTKAAETISVFFQNSGGAVSQSSIMIAAQGHMAFLLPTQFPGTASDHGQAEFFTANGGIALIGLQSNPANFFTTTEVYPVNGPIIIGGHDPEPCIKNPLSPGCPQPPFFSTTLTASISSSPVQITVTPDTDGTYTAALNATVNGASVSGSFVGGVATCPIPGQFHFSCSSVGSGSTFGSGSLTFSLTETSFDAMAYQAVGDATGSITVNQGGAMNGTISGTYSELISPASTLTFSVQSRSPGTGNLLMSVKNTGVFAATNVTITSITGITASGATFVYSPGLLNPPFVVPGAANLVPGASSGFNLFFNAASGNPGSAFSFIITAQADNVAPFTTRISVH